MNDIIFFSLLHSQVSKWYMYHFDFYLLNFTAASRYVQYETSSFGRSFNPGSVVIKHSYFKVRTIAQLTFDFISSFVSWSKDLHTIHGLPTTTDDDAAVNFNLHIYNEISTGRRCNPSFLGNARRLGDGKNLILADRRCWCRNLFPSDRRR